MSSFPSPEFAEAASSLLDSIFDLSGVHCICLWQHDGGGHLRRAGIRSDLPGDRDTLALEPDEAHWLEVSRGTVWRMSAHPMTGDAIDGLLFVQYAIAGRFLAEMGLDSESEVSPEIMAEIGRSFGLLAGMLEGRSEAEPATGFTAIDAEFIESIAMGDSAFIVELLEIAEAELDQGWRDVVDHLAEGRLAISSSLAHRMRSTARTLGAAALDEALLDLENSAGALDAEASAHLARAASEAVADTRADIQRMLSSRRP